MFCHIGILLLALLVMLTNVTSALSIAIPDWETFGRSSPLIITAEAQGSARYKLIDDYTFDSYTTYKVLSVQKNILTDFNIDTSNPIEVVRRRPGPWDFDNKSAQEWIGILNENPRKSELEKEPVILCLTLNNKGEWCHAIPQMRLNVESRFDDMKTAGLFAPVGIDGIEATYSLKEWQDIADADITRSYYGLNFPESRPANWPETFEEAVHIVVTAFENTGRIPILGNSDTQEALNESIGLAKPKSKERDGWQINKTLLLNMGRIGPLEARNKITKAAIETLNERYPVDLKEIWSSSTIKMINYTNGKPLKDCIEDLASQVKNTSNMQIRIAPEIAERGVNISLRNLDAFRCLTFITQQVGCAVEVEIPFDDTTIINIIDDNQ